jgi:hypothetical protein
MKNCRPSCPAIPSSGSFLTPARQADQTGRRAFLIAPHVLTGDHVVPPGRRHPGHPRKLRGEHGDAAFLVGGPPDPGAQPERGRELPGEERHDRLAGDPPDDLADEPPEGQGVIAVRRARLPDRGLSGERLGDRAAVEDILERQLAVDDRESRPVTEDLPDRDPVLARWRRNHGPVRPR